MSNEEPESIPLSDYDADLNWIESVIETVSPTDEYLSALIEVNKAILRSERKRLEESRQQAAINGAATDVDNVDGGMFSDNTEGALPEDAVGVVTRDTQPNNIGPGMFRINGSPFYAMIKNDDDEVLQAGDTVRVLGGPNKVTRRGAGGIGLLGGGGLGESYFRYKGRLYRIPQVVDRNQDVKVSNQSYADGNYTDIDGSLGAGETKEIARIEPPRDSFFLLKYTNATLHDTVRYNYYIDNQTDPDEDLSGSIPWATPPELHEVIPGGWQLVEDYVYLELVEESGNTEYDTVQASLTGIEMEV